METIKVQRIVSFKQKTLLKPYNFRKIKKATNNEVLDEFDRLLFDAFCGKTIGNLKNKVHIGPVKADDTETMHNYKKKKWSITGFKS